MIDLHIHTSFSDGQYTPTDIINKAFESNISVIAITDHDTVAGLEEGEVAANKVGIKFIKGIELNIDWPTGEFHLLGLALSSISESLLEIINFLQNNRKLRNLEMIKKMNEGGVEISYDTICKMFPGRTIGRPHFAQYLKEKKIVKNTQQAFDKYLGKDRAWYAPRIACPLEKAIKAINDSGGVPVIAHPLSLYVSWGNLNNILEDLHSRGVKGVEAYHPSVKEHECERLEKLAHKYNMFVTAGSDFHGEKIRSDRRLGHTSGGKKIDDRFYYDELVNYITP